MGEDTPQVKFPPLVKNFWGNAHSLSFPNRSSTDTVQRYSRAGDKRLRGKVVWREVDATQPLSYTVEFSVDEMAVETITRELLWDTISGGKAQERSTGFNSCG